MLDRGRSQDARAPGGVIGIQRAGKMHAALGGRAFAGDHAVAHDGRAHGLRYRGRNLAVRGRRSVRRAWPAEADIGITLLSFLFWVQHFHAGVNEWLTIRNSDREFFRWLPICRFARPSSVRRTGGRRDGGHKRQYRGNPDFCRPCGLFAARSAGSKEDARSSRSREKDLPFFSNRSLERLPPPILEETNLPCNLNDMRSKHGSPDWRCGPGFRGRNHRRQNQIP